MDILYVWAVKDMKRNNIDIDPDAFVVHSCEKYLKALEGVVDVSDYISKAEKAVNIHENVLKDREKNKN